MCLKDADRIANSVDPDRTAPEQSDLGLHCLPRSSLIRVYIVCLNLRIIKTMTFLRLSIRSCSITALLNLSLISVSSTLWNRIKNGSPSSVNS